MRHISTSLYWFICVKKRRESVTIHVLLSMSSFFLSRKVGNWVLSEDDISLHCTAIHAVFFPPVSLVWQYISWSSTEFWVTVTHFYFLNGFTTHSFLFFTEHFLFCQFVVADFCMCRSYTNVHIVINMNQTYVHVCVSP